MQRRPAGHGRRIEEPGEQWLRNTRLFGELADATALVDDHSQGILEGAHIGGDALQVVEAHVRRLHLPSLRAVVDQLLNIGDDGFALGCSGFIPSHTPPFAPLWLGTKMANLHLGAGMCTHVSGTNVA